MTKIGWLSRLPKELPTRTIEPSACRWELGSLLLAAGEPESRLPNARLSSAGELPRMRAIDPQHGGTRRPYGRSRW